MANVQAKEEEYVGPALSAHDKQYIGVGFGLAVITAVEVVLYSVEKNGDISAATNTWALLVLSFIKFVIVAAFFMHLKTDNPIFRRMFVVGAALAGFAYLATLTAFGVFKTWVPWVAYLVFALVGIALAFRKSPAKNVHADLDHGDHVHDHGADDHVDHAVSAAH